MMLWNYVNFTKIEYSNQKNKDDSIEKNTYKYGLFSKRNYNNHNLQNGNKKQIL